MMERKLLSGPANTTRTMTLQQHGLQFYKCGHKQKHPSGWELLTWDI